MCSPGFLEWTCTIFFLGLLFKSLPALNRCDAKILHPNILRHIVEKEIFLLIPNRTHFAINMFYLCHFEVCRVCVINSNAVKCATFGHIFYWHIGQMWILAHMMLSIVRIKFYWMRASGQVVFEPSNTTMYSYRHFICRMMTPQYGTIYPMNPTVWNNLWYEPHRMEH